MKEDIKGIFTHFRIEDGGRRYPAFTTYRPHHDIDGYLTTGVHRYIATDTVPAGESAEVFVRFITPEAYPSSLFPGKVLPVGEGSRVVGSLEVTEVYNDVLRKDESLVD